MFRYHSWLPNFQFQILNCCLVFAGQCSRVSRLRSLSRTPNFASKLLQRSSVRGGKASDARASTDTENADAIVTQKRHLRVTLGRADPSDVVQWDSDEPDAARLIVWRRLRRRNVVESFRLRFRVDVQPGSVLPLSVREGERGHDDRLESDARASRSASTGIGRANRRSRALVDASPPLRHGKWSAARFQSLLLVI